MVTAIHLTPVGNAFQQSILRMAAGFVGTPYLLGGKSRVGIDCSGFICAVYLDVTRDPRMVPETQNIARLRKSRAFIDVNDAYPGDLILWFDHGGIVWDPTKGMFIGSQTSTGVKPASYTSGFWSRQRDRLFRRYHGFPFPLRASDHADV